MNKCPYTEICRAEALETFADAPELLAVFQHRTQCSEQNERRAIRCATRLGLTEKTLPTLGGYVQQRRREQNLPQLRLAREVGIELQTLRDLENNKLEKTKVSQSLIERLGKALSASSDYLAALIRHAAPPAAPRLRTSFTRITPPTDDQKETDS